MGKVCKQAQRRIYYGSTSICEQQSHDMNGPHQRREEGGWCVVRSSHIHLTSQNSIKHFLSFSLLVDLPVSLSPSSRPTCILSGHRCASLLVMDSSQVIHEKTFPIKPCSSGDWVRSRPATQARTDLRAYMLRDTAQAVRKWTAGCLRIKLVTSTQGRNDLGHYMKPLLFAP